MEILLKPKALGGITRKTEEYTIELTKNLEFYGQPVEFCGKKGGAIGCVSMNIK